MQNFSLKKRGNSRRSFLKAVAGTLIALGVVILLVVLFRGMFGVMGSFVSSPLYGIHAWFSNGTHSIPSYFRDRNTLQSEIDSLKETILANQGNAFTIGRLELENTELRSLLGGRDTEERIAAGVVSRPPHMPYDALLIDRGAYDGIEEGAVVYYTADRAIGVVARVYETSAVITLFSTPHVETTAYISGPNIYTTAYGAGGGVIRVSVPQGIVLAENDLVLLPGLPAGVLGKISAIQSEATNPEQNAYIVHDVPLQSLKMVSVGTVVPPALSFEEARASIEAQKRILFVDVPEGVLVDVGTTTAATNTEETTSE